MCVQTYCVQARPVHSALAEVIAMPSLPLDEFMLDVNDAPPSIELETTRATKRFLPSLRASTATAHSGTHTHAAVSAKTTRRRQKRQMMNVTSIGESKLLGIQVCSADNLIFVYR